MAWMNRKVNTYFCHSITFLFPPLISRVAGEIFAVSLGQGGPPPLFLQEWCYQYLVTRMLKDITKENVHDAELSTLIEKVGWNLKHMSFPLWKSCVKNIFSGSYVWKICFQIENATDETQYTEEIFNRGYTGPIILEHKDSIVRYMHCFFYSSPNV